MELPKTEDELQSLINKAVEEATTKLTGEFDGKFASQRTKYENQIRELKNSIGKSAEELAQQRMQEQYEADQKELAELRGFKKTTLISERLAKDGLPKYFVNDSRLMNASEEDFEKAFKLVKSEYEATLPKGNNRSNVVPVNTNAPSTNDPKQDAYNKMGDVLKNLIG